MVRRTAENLFKGVLGASEEERVSIEQVCASVVLCKASTEFGRGFGDLKLGYSASLSEATFR